MVGYSSATILYMNKVIVGANNNLSAFDRLRPLSQQILEKANVMSNITDRLNSLEKKLDAALEAIPKLKTQTMHRSNEIMDLLSKMEIQRHFTMANPGLTHELNVLTLMMSGLSELNDKDTKEWLRQKRKVAVIPVHAERLAKRWLRMSNEIAAMMQEWLEKANNASVGGDSSAKDEEYALVSVYNEALNAGK